jgi:hypothetical protein
MANWDQRFMELAGLVAGWSKDRSRQVGCVIVAPDNSLRSIGFKDFRAASTMITTIGMRAPPSTSGRNMLNGMQFMRLRAMGFRSLVAECICRGFPASTAPEPSSRQA